MPTHDVRPQSSTSTSTSTTPSEAEHAVEPQALVGNQAIIDVISQLNQPTGERERNPNKNGIVFMGLNTYAHDEARTLNQLNAGDGGAVAAKPQAKQDHVTHNGKQHDLTTEEGAATYIATLGLPDQKAVEVATMLSEAGSQSRDELAQLIRILSEVEMGERSMERMVLSGHSVGSQIWGDDNGNISFSFLAQLLELFPAASEQLEHLMLSACYSGGEAKMDQYHEMFPNLDSIFAYHGSSPGTWSGAMDHMGAWESATEPGKDAAGVDPSLAEGMRKSDNVSTWNTADGYQGDKPMSVWEIEQSLSSQEYVYANHLSGSAEVTDSQSGPLRTFYGLIQRALSHPELSSSRIAELEHRRDVTIRLLYFNLISSRFVEHHGELLAEGVAAAGLAVPDLGSIGRRETLDFITTLAGCSGDQSTVMILDLLQRGLRDLSSAVIPTSWV